MERRTKTKIVVGVGLGLAVASSNSVARAAADDGVERGTLGVGVGSTLTGFGPGLGGLGAIGGAPYTGVWIEPRLSDRLSLIASVGGNYAVARAGGESARSLYFAPGLGLRLWLAEGPLRPSVYVLGTGSYASAHFQDETTRAVGFGAEFGASIDGSLSNDVRLRASVALASIAHARVLDSDASTTSARFGIAPMLGVGFVY